MEIATAGTIAPEASETVPVTVARSPWAKALVERRHNNRE